MDLHTWITQQVDRVEETARAELYHRRVVFQPHNGGPAITGVVTGTTQCADGIQLDVAQCGVEPRDGTPASVESVTAVLRRCEADRRILARHQAWPQSRYCDGCDQDLTTNLNDCPELLDLAHAHGITPDIITGLDQPKAPEPKSWLDQAEDYLYVANLGRGIRPITTSDVPEALRGPRWKS